VKRVARGLRPPELEEVGLSAAIQAHARGLRESAGLEVTTALAEVDNKLSLDARLAVYRMVQESLSNVMRHSGVSSASVTLALDDHVVTLVVEDQGRGFSPHRLPAGGSGLGLIGLHERALMAGGEVDIVSSPGEGTRVIVRLPTLIPPQAVRH
jgi:signal transduction histidine kinase